MIGLELRMADAAIAGDDEHHARDDPPPRGSSEQIEQEIGEPRAGDAAAVRRSARRRPRTTSRDRTSSTSRESARARGTRRRRGATTIRARAARTAATATARAPARAPPRTLAVFLFKNMDLRHRLHVANYTPPSDGSASRARSPDAVGAAAIGPTSSVTRARTGRAGSEGPARSG